MINFKQNLAHALLITGETQASEQALQADLKLLLCENPGASACTLCPSCQLFESAAGHPDLSVIRPEGKLNVIKIESVRQVITFLEQSSLRGGRRLVVFVEADTLNIASQNALLKSLEEPGARTVLLLLTSKPHLLLPTIRSRCQVLHFGHNPQTQDEALTKVLLAPGFDPLQFVEANKNQDLLHCVHIQMRIIYDLMHTHPRLELAQLYRDLAQKSALFQKKVAVNVELNLFELALAWKRLIADNINHSPETAE